MDKRKNVIVIGAGIGGISTAGYLASRGYNVTIFEKNSYPGGRCGQYMKGGHRFDIGATFLMMPGVYNDAFSAVGKNLTDELDLIRVDPVYKVKFPRNKEILFTSDLATLQKQFEEVEKGSFSSFLKPGNYVLFSHFRIYTWDKIHFLLLGCISSCHLWNLPMV